MQKLANFELIVWCLDKQLLNIDLVHVRKDNGLALKEDDIMSAS